MEENIEKLAGLARVGGEGRGEIEKQKMRIKRDWGRERENDPKTQRSSWHHEK